MFTAEPVKPFPIKSLNTKAEPGNEASAVYAALTQGMLDASGINPKASDVKCFHLHATMTDFLKVGGRKHEPLDLSIQNERYRFRASHIEHRSDAPVVLGFLKTPGGMTHVAAMMLVGKLKHDA